MSRALLSVHPHPDDETIACGGILARYAEEGVRVKVVTCTAGEEGENLAGIELGDEEMTAIRVRELAAALDALGVTDHEFLGYRDSGMAGEPSNELADSFHRADLDEAAGRLAAIIRELRPEVVISDDETGTYGHPDHIKANRVTDRAIELAADADALPGAGPAWEVPKRYVHALPRSRLFSFHERMLEEGLASPFGDEPIEDPDDVPFGVRDDEITTSIDVGPWLDRKREALRAHASQIGADSFFLNLPDDVAREMFGTEHYIRLRGPGPERETDLFAGLEDAT